MRTNKKTKRTLFKSFVALILCISMLLGSTYAWFTDSVESGNNIIEAGNLDIELYYQNDEVTTWTKVTETTNVFKNVFWEPGHSEMVRLKVVNEGSLALKYQLGANVVGETGSTNVKGEEFKLSDYIKYGFVDGMATYTRDEAVAAVEANATSLSIRYNSGTIELPAADSANSGVNEKIVTMVVYMPNTVGNEANYDKAGGAPVPTINLGINLFATQMQSESDSFGPDYDADAFIPPVIVNQSVTTNVTPDAENKVPTGGAQLDNGSVGANLPEGVQLDAGTEKLTLNVKPIKNSASNIVMGINDVKTPIDVHIEGVSENNTVPMEVTLTEAVTPGLNAASLKIYHVEDGATIQMVSVPLDESFTAHNQYKYDPATGYLTLYVATFSEFDVVSDTVNPWGGDYDYTWYTNPRHSLEDGEVTEYVIANADQLAGLSAIVGGMAKDKEGAILEDSFEGKTVKLVSYINIGDLESSKNNFTFYPIGYYNSTGEYNKVSGVSVTSGFNPFMGTFDGNGNTIANFYQNTWEMFGDYNDGYSNTPNHYRDGMGLFGKVYGGTVKNLTVENFSSDGEYTTTGTIAAYADCGATFENIAIFNCNPRVYNIGNGGIVGCVGWYTKDAADSPVTFKNITVDNTNKITALWGSWDVACGGIVGQYYPTSGQTSAGSPKNAGIHFQNCNIAAQIDVYNDVCANYQYYAYRYSGILLGSVRENVTIDGHSYPKMDGITAANCTVNFGDWNDYYYCELVANSQASYTHDYQMSRLEQVLAVDVENGTVTSLAGVTTSIPKEGRVNYVVVKAKNDDGSWKHGDGHNYADCYHFVNGEVWDHATSGKENVGDVEVLVEDKQCIYREFKNLVTGYGWGVTSLGVEGLDGVITDTKETSVEKFKPVYESKSVDSGTKVKLGELFAAIEGAKINSATVQVYVSPVGDKSTASATYVANTSDWTQGTLTFHGEGVASVVITDYDYCIATTLSLTVGDMSSKTFKANNSTVSKKATEINGIYKTYVTLNELFSLVGGAPSVGSLKIQISDGLNYRIDYANNWSDAGIDFTGLGSVTVALIGPSEGEVVCVTFEATKPGIELPLA